MLNSMIKPWNGGGSLPRSAGGSLLRSSGGCLERSSGGYLSGISISSLKQRIARKTGIPTTTAGIERKIGRSAINLLTGLFSKKKN